MVAGEIKTRYQYVEEGVGGENRREPLSTIFGEI